MTQETTIAKEEAGTKPASDLVPLSASQQMAKAGDDVNDLADVSAEQTQNLVHLEPVKRKKTWGEYRFNLMTYGGWALLGNEAASLVITESIKKNSDGTPRFAHGIYEKFETKVAGLARHFERFEKPGLMRSIGDYIGGVKARNQPARLPYLLVATIGGMLVVPFIKDREDRKGEIVRKLDRKHYGLRADTDPELIAAHKEMDEAPRQSWSSLGWGRLVTVISATIADFTFGWPEALTTKPFQNNATYQKFSSLERLSETFANWSSKAAKVKPANEQLFKKIVGNGTWLLTLSSSLTAIFYISSKVFAKKRDQRLEQRYAQLHDKKETLNADETALADTLQEATNQSPEILAKQTIEKARISSQDQPQPKVSNVKHETTVAPATQLAASAT